jgi:hypothetical protein
MSRKPGLALQVAILMGAGLLAAPDASASIICPDTYCGQRAYADPYIWDGFRGSKGYRGAEFYGRSWYLLRTLRPVYVPVDEHPGYPQVQTKYHSGHHKTLRVHRKRR